MARTVLSACLERQPISHPAAPVRENCPDQIMNIDLLYRTRHSVVYQLTVLGTGTVPGYVDLRGGTINYEYRYSRSTVYTPVNQNRPNHGCGVCNPDEPKRLRVCNAHHTTSLPVNCMGTRIQMTGESAWSIQYGPPICRLHNRGWFTGIRILVVAWLGNQQWSVEPNRHADTERGGGGCCSSC